MVNFEFKIVRITNSELFEHLKDIDVYGRVTEDKSFILYGCRVKDENRFYKGIYEYDEKTEIIGFESIEDVKSYWEEGADMLMHINKGDFEIIKSEDEKMKNKPCDNCYISKRKEHCREDNRDI